MTQTMNPEAGKTIIEILKHRCNEWTRVVLQSGQELKVFNIAWGYDLGDDYAHITTNISPPNEEIINSDFFKVDEVIKLEDEESGRIIWSLD
jgi:hypothetical protein